MKHAVLIIALLSVGLAVQAENRTWTSQSGATMDAEFVALSGNLVKLKTTTGRSIAIQMAKLSEADQAFIKQQSGSADASSVNDALNQMRAGLGQGTRNVGYVLSEEDIGKFITKLPDPKNPEKGYLLFTATFGTPSLSASDKRKWSAREKAPFRITAQLERVQVRNGKTEARRLGGKAYMYILDEDDQIVDSSTGSLDKLCPT